MAENDPSYTVDICFRNDKVKVLPISCERVEYAAENGRQTVYYPYLCPFHGLDNHGGGYAIVQADSESSAIKKARHRINIHVNTLKKQSEKLRS